MQAASEKAGSSENIHHEISEIGFRETMSFNVRQRNNIIKALKWQYKTHGGVIRVKMPFIGISLMQLLGPEWNQVVYMNRDNAFSGQSACTSGICRFSECEQTVPWPRYHGVTAR